jgi:hypothetical protein
LNQYGEVVVTCFWLYIYKQNNGRLYSSNQEVSVPGPPKITALSTSIYIAEPVIKDVPEKRKSKISHVSHDATHIMLYLQTEQRAIVFLQIL